MSKVAIITGASKGIGAATAIAFGNAGYEVVVNYKDDAAAARKVVQGIEKAGSKGLAVQANCFTEAGVKKLFSEVKSKYKTIDVLINNVGHPIEPSFGNYTLDNINLGLSDNVGAAILCSQEAVKIMSKGCILFTSSNFGLQFGGNPYQLIYSASKAAMINFAQTLAERLSPDIRCNVVAPGTTKTAAWEGIPLESAQKTLDMNLLKEWVQPEEIASAFVFLAETPHITGQTIVIDAGWQKKFRYS